MQKRPHYHTNRVNEDIARELMYILQNVKDPRVSKSFVSVTKTETTPDLKYCKAYISVMGSDEEKKDTIAGLRSAEGYVRRQLAKRLNLRNTPEIQFVLDQSIEYGVHMSRLIDEVNKETPERDEEDDK